MSDRSLSLINFCSRLIKEYKIAFIRTETFRGDSFSVAHRISAALRHLLNQELAEGGTFFHQNLPFNLDGNISHRKEMPDLIKSFLYDKFKPYHTKKVNCEQIFDIIVKENVKESSPIDSLLKQLGFTFTSDDILGCQVTFTTPEVVFKEYMLLSTITGVQSSLTDKGILDFFLEVSSLSPNLKNIRLSCMDRLGQFKENSCQGLLCAQFSLDNTETCIVGTISVKKV